VIDDNDDSTFHLQRFIVPLADDLGRAQADIDELKAKVQQLLNAKRLRGLAMPEVPNYLKPHILVEWNGRKYVLSEIAEDIPESELSIVPPANADKLDDVTLRGLSQYYHAELAAYRERLSDLQADRDISRHNLNRTKRLVAASLKGEVDPGTGKNYTEAAKKLAVEGDPRVEEETKLTLIHESTYDNAAAIVAGRKDIVEGLNRLRMARDANFSPGRIEEDPRRRISGRDRNKWRKHGE